MNPVRRYMLQALAGGLVGVRAAQAADRWTLSAEQPDGNYITAVAREFAADVAKSTQGEFDIKVHSNSVLFKRADVKHAVQSDQIQAGDFLVSVLGNEDAIYEVDAVPLLARNFDDAWKLWRASRGFLEARLAGQGVKLLYSVPWPPQGLYAKNPIETIDDFKGMKFRADNAATARLADLLGAVPTTINSGDVPQAFGTGMVDAMLASPATGVDRQAWDFSRYFYVANAFIPKNVLVVNACAFAKLPPDTQKAVLASADRAEKRGWELGSNETSKLVDTLAKHGMQVEPTPPALEASLGKIGATLAQEWVQRAGPDGQAILDKASIRR